MYNIACVSDIYLKGQHNQCSCHQYLQVFFGKDEAEVSPKNFVLEATDSQLITASQYTDKWFLKPHSHFQIFSIVQLYFRYQDSQSILSLPNNLLKLLLPDDKDLD